MAKSAKYQVYTSDEIRGWDKTKVAETEASIRIGLSKIAMKVMDQDPTEKKVMKKNLARLLTSRFAPGTVKTKKAGK